MLRRSSALLSVMLTGWQVMLTTPANLHCDDKHHIFDIQWEVRENTCGASQS